MATPNELLAKSLKVLAKQQKAGFVQEVVRGWYLPSRPDEPAGSSSAWFTGMREFIAGYCEERFGADWHVSPDQSLMLRTGERSLPLQLQVWATGANNQPVQLPHDCSLFLYRAPKLCESEVSPDAGGLRLATLPAALMAVGSAFFTQQPLAARIALASLEAAQDRPCVRARTVHD
jgi:hypothetical protein